MKLKIQTGLNNPILRTIGEEITDFSEAKKIVKDMKEFLKNSDDGVGLAAPQVGVSKKIFLACVEQNKDGEVVKEKITAFINPKILEFSEEKGVGQEGCLSLPGVFGDVERSKEIEVEYQNLRGETVKKKLFGFGAVVFQHEFDHVNGILFFDKIINGEFVMEKGVDLKSLDIEI